MTRALFVHSGNLRGGVERVLESIAQSKHLCPGLESRFALCFEGRVAPALREAGSSVDVLGAVRVTRPTLVMRARTKLATLIRRDRPDVIVTTSVWAHALFAPVARRHRVPLAMWAHDVLSGQPWLEKLAGRYQPDLLICNSRYTERAARTVFPAVSSRVVHCPLALETVTETRQDARRRYGVADDEVVIATVGRMEPYKGQHALIEALAHVEAYAPWVCWIVGGAQRAVEEAYARSLREAVDARGLQSRVRFLGQRDDVMSILNAADVYCHPAQGAEPFGLALVEALHAGLPVVATSLGGPEEIVTDMCGRLVPIGDIPALADALSWLVGHRDLRHALAAEGPPRASALCSPGPRLEELRQAFDHLLARAAA